MQRRGGGQEEGGGGGQEKVGEEEKRKKRRVLEAASTKTRFLVFALVWFPSLTYFIAAFFSSCFPRSSACFITEK